MKRAFLLTAAVILVIVVWAVPGFADPAGGGWTRLATAGRNAEDVNGNHAVAYFDGREWRALGLASGGKNFQDRNFTVPSFTETSGQKQLRIRIAQSGGGASHIDAVTIGGKGPVSAAFLGADGTDALLLRKLQSVDHDVADSFGKTLEVVFPADSAGHLELNARVEATEISKTPFAFPEKNQYRQITSSSSFYTYELGSKNAFSRKPDFKVYTRPGSGHPEGWASGWIANDEKNLLFRLDFTSDNTLDGTKDYAKIYVAAGGGLRVFAQSMQDLDYGTPAFTYTDTAAYQHKVYEFKIPLEKVVTGPGTRLVRYAAEAYGTASPYLGSVFPRLSYDAAGNRYLLVYASGSDFFELSPYARLYSWDMVPLSAPAAVSTSSGQYYSYGDDDVLPSSAFASNGSSLVVWSESESEVWARRLASDGTPLGSMVQLSNRAYYVSRSSAVVYNPASNKYFVIWTEYNETSMLMEIKGCYISASTGLKESTLDLAQDAFYDLTQPRIAYGNGDYLIVWLSSENQIQAQKFSAAGTALGGLASLSSGPANDSPDIAYDNAGKRFLAVWTTNNDYNLVYGSLLDVNGDVLVGEFQLSAPSDVQDYAPVVTYSAREGLYVVSWARHEDSVSIDPYLQKVTQAGALSGTNVLIVSGAYSGSPEYRNGGIARVSNTRNGDNLTVSALYTGTQYTYDLSYSLYDYPNAAAPAAPVLSSPANGELVQGTTVTLQWEQVTGSGITYRVFCGTDSGFANTGAFTQVAAGPSPFVYALAGSGLFALLSAAFAASGSAKGSKKRLTLNILVFLLAAAFFSAALTACPIGSSSDDTDGPVIKEHVVTGLSSATTYYWKVVTDNGEALKSSSVRSFTTQ